MANIDNKKYIITDKERDVRRVARLHDRPNNNGSYGKAGLGPDDVKKAFDAAVDLVVEKHNNFVEDVSLQVNEHSLLIGNPSDMGVGDENVYQVFRYAKKAIETVSETLGSEDDESGADTMYGQAKRAGEAVEQAEKVLGNEDDESGADTMYGQAKRAEEAVEQAEKVLGNEGDESGADTVYGQKAALLEEAGKLLGDSDDQYSDNSMHGIYNAALALTLGGESSALGDALKAIIGIQESYMKGIMPINRVYPVGAIYMSVDPTSPASLFGGTWESLKDRFLLGVGDTYEVNSTGGSATHRHASGSLFAQIASNGEGAIRYQEIDTTDITGGHDRNKIINANGGLNASDAAAWVNPATAVGGTTAEASTLPPYLAVYMWKRIA